MIRRFLTRVLMVILIAVCGYNIWQVQQLKAQVTHLQALAEIRGTHAVKSHPASEPTASEGTPQGWLDAANSHLARAHTALSQGNFGLAHAELDRSVDAMHQAAAVPQAQTKQALDRWHRQFTALQKQADALLPKEPASH